MSRRLAVLLLVLGLGLAAQRPEPGGAPPTWEQLEAQGEVLTGVDLEVIPVFDARQKDEDHWGGRLANRLHIDTTDGPLRRELLFPQTGPVNARLIRETERRLRARGIWKEAEIRPVRDAEGHLRALVHVKDGWTLKASIGFSHVGGQNAVDWTLHDLNFLGSTKQVRFMGSNDPVRKSLSIGYDDPHLFASNWTLNLGYDTLSDGRIRFLRLERPPVPSDAPWAAGLAARDAEEPQVLFDQRVEVSRFAYRAQEVVAWGNLNAWSQDDQVFRVGLRLAGRDRTYGTPTDPLALGLPGQSFAPFRQRGWLGTVSYRENRYGAYRNLAAVRQLEDYNLGWTGQVALGRMESAFGSTRPGLWGDAQVTKGWRLPGDGLLLGSLATAGARWDGQWREVVQRGALTAYLPWGSQTTAAHLDWQGYLNPAPEQVLYLGGNEGFRGYPNYLFIGDRRWLVTLEQRFFTERTLWGVFQLGFNAFLDAGAIRRSETGLWSRVYSDIGGGLRLGNLKSTYGRTWILNISWPLVRDPLVNRSQIVVSNTMTF